jgi:hypothetical protein
MEKEADNLNLIDLLNSKYYKYKKLNEKSCTSSYNKSITSSEWSVIYLIRGKQSTISELVIDRLNELLHNSSFIFLNL